MSTAPRAPTATPSRASGRRAEIAAYPVTPGSVAPVGHRVLAYAVDVLITLAAVAIGVVVATSVATQASGPPVLLPVLFGLVVVLGQWVAEALSGATLGNAATGIRTVSALSGRPAGPVPILVRHLVIAAGALVLLVGQWIVVASGAWDRSPAQRGWHDKAAGTLVLRAGAVGRGVGPASTVAAWDTAVARIVGQEQPGPVADAGPGEPQRPAPWDGAAPLAAAPPAAAPPAPAWVAPAPVPAPVTRPVTAVAPLISGPPEVPSGLPATPAPPVVDGSRRSRRNRETPAVPTGRSGLRLRFDTGEELDVAGDGLVGRRPTAETGTVHAVAIDDPDRSISRVHLAFGPESGARLWVMDRGSTNGTVLVGPDGARAALPPGTRAVVEAGWTVRFGRRSLEVLDR